MSNCNCVHDYSHGAVDIADYYHAQQPTWCGGCGNYGIRAALLRALTELGIKPHEVLLCFDIGCNGNGNDKMRGYRIHTLHGRVLPVAAAAKIANPRLHVIAMAGDGATYSEGINHFVNTVRNNYPITFIVHDNGNYGLTTGQASATTPQGAVRSANPDGPTATTLNPLALALSLQPSYLARGFSGDILGLTGILKEAIQYQQQGLAFVNVLQACPTYNKETTHDWYLERVRPLAEIAGYDPEDYRQAWELVHNTEKLHAGTIYRNPSLPNYLERLTYRQQGEWAGSAPVDEVRNFDTSALLAKYR